MFALSPLPVAGALLLVLAGCASPPPASVADVHVPPFARLPYAGFHRTDAVEIALAEWRAFGGMIDDDPPGGRVLPTGEDKPERLPGLWQRVGVYWWLGQDATLPEAAWTGKHDADGRIFPPAQDGDFAWSAAFISYVMRLAGAGPRFPYSPAHHTYIDAAARMARGEARGLAVLAERPDAYAPVQGDLICLGRGAAKAMRYDDLPASGPYPAHCDIVVKTGQVLSVIGGNVDDAVTLKHVPVTPEGMLAPPGGPVLDTRYRWFVVLRVLYDAEVVAALPPPAAAPPQ
jgi:hypothetical protein